MVKKTLSDKQILRVIQKNTEVLDFTESGANGHTLKHLKTLLGKQPHGTYKTLEMYGNGMGDSGIENLCTFLDTFPRVQTVNLEYNELTSDGALYLFDYMKNNKNVTHLSLYGNRLIGDIGADCVAACLQSNDVLESLNLFHCGFTDEGAKVIIKSLEKNKTLKSLKIDNNDIDQRLEELLELYMERNNGKQVSIPTVAEVIIPKQVASSSQDEERSLYNVPQYQPLPKIEIRYTAKTRVDYDEERQKMMATYERLLRERQELLAILNKENDVILPDRKASQRVLKPMETLPSLRPDAPIPGVKSTPVEEPTVVKPEPVKEQPKPQLVVEEITIEEPKEDLTPILDVLTTLPVPPSTPINTTPAHPVAQGLPIKTQIRQTFGKHYTDGKFTSDHLFAILMDLKVVPVNVLTETSLHAILLLLNPTLGFIYHTEFVEGWEQFGGLEEGVDNKISLLTNLHNKLFESKSTDGNVTREQLGELFDKIDTDNDGKVNFKDVATAVGYFGNTKTVDPGLILK
jgi:hypothetical protein